MRTWCRPSAPVPTTPTFRRVGEAGAGESLVGGLSALPSRSRPAAAASRRVLIDAPAGALDESEQIQDFGVRLDLGADALQGLRRVELAAHQEAESAVEAGDRRGVEALALQADRVQAEAGGLH